MGRTKTINADMARLEAAAAGAGCALACAHQSSDEFHSALIRDYLRLHGRNHTALFAVAAGIVIAMLIWF